LEKKDRSAHLNKMIKNTCQNDGSQNMEDLFRHDNNEPNPVHTERMNKVDIEIQVMKHRISEKNEQKKNLVEQNTFNKKSNENKVAK